MIVTCSLVTIILINIDNNINILFIISIIFIISIYYYCLVLIIKKAPWLVKSIIVGWWNMLNNIQLYTLYIIIWISNIC